MSLRFVALAAACVLAFSACYEESGGLDSDADATIVGRVVDDAGGGVPGARVKIRKLLQPEEIPNHRLRVLEDLGLACVDERAPERCFWVDRDVTSDESGRFQVEMKGHDTTDPGGGCGFFSDDDCVAAMHVAAVAPRGEGELTGASRSRRIGIDDTYTPLGALRLWRPTLELSADSVSTILHLGSGPPSGATPVAYLVVGETGDGEFVWAQLMPPVQRLRLDGRLFEDHVAALSVLALDANGYDVYRSARIPVRGTAGAPASRSKPCDGDSSCALTDGDLGTAAELASGAASPAVDLGGPVLPSLVTVRGCRSCRVEVSADGEEWTGGAIGPVLFPDPQTVADLQAAGEEDAGMLSVVEFWQDLMQPTGDPVGDAVNGITGAMMAPAIPLLAFGEALGQMFAAISDGGDSPPYDWSDAPPNVGAWVPALREDAQPIRYVRVVAPAHGARVSEVSVWTADGPGANAPIEVVSPDLVGWPPVAGAPIDWMSVLARAGFVLLALTFAALILVMTHRPRRRAMRSKRIPGASLPPWLPPLPTVSDPPPPPDVAEPVNGARRPLRSGTRR